MSATNNLFPFVFFGCWNQPGYGNNSSQRVPRDAVASAITSLSDIKAIVLGGDNVYPRPLRSEKKNKIHEREVFLEGIQLYNAAHVPIIPSFGNHNESLIDEQKEFFKLDKTYNAYEFAEHVHIIVLDTNLFVRSPDDSLYKEMLAWFRHAVASIPEDHTYFVVQHEPYFTARKKGLGELVNADPFLDILFARPPIAILCADTHHYQHATIQRAADQEIKIHQFIVGTGGANPDLHMEGFKDAIIREKYVFTQVNAAQGYGYLRISDTNPQHFEFVHVLDWVPPTRGGNRRRGCTRSYRSSQRKTRRRSH